MDTLAEMIRTRLKSGALPGSLDFAQCWYGRGSGRECLACQRPIPAFATEVEGHLQDGTVVYFHGLCYRTWDVERLRDE